VKQKLLSAVLGILVMVPGMAFAQGARSPLGSIKPPTSVHNLSPSATRHLPELKSRSSTSTDSNANGTIIGAVIGGVAGAFLGAGLASIDENSDSFAGPVVLMAMLGAAGGGGIGYAVDKAHQQVTYRIPVSRNVSIDPGIGLAKRPGQSAVSPRASVGAMFRW